MLSVNSKTGQTEDGHSCMYRPHGGNGMSPMTLLTVNENDWAKIKTCEYVLTMLKLLYTPPELESDAGYFKMHPDTFKEFKRGLRSSLFSSNITDGIFETDPDPYPIPTPRFQGIDIRILDDEPVDVITLVHKESH